MLSAALLAATLQAATCTSCPAEPIVIGHRGSGVSDTDNPFAENTLESVENAFAEGADMAEIDVQLSRDGQVIVMHDFDLEKTTGLTGCVADFDYATLATADATVGSGAKTKVGVPLFTDVLAAAIKAERKLNIEVKVNPPGETCPATDAHALVGKMLNIVVAQNAHVDGRVFVSSFSFEALEEARRREPSIAVGYLTAEGGAELLKAADRAKAAGFAAINPIFFTVSEDLTTLEQLKDKGLRVYPWTVNDAKFMTKLLEAGVDGIITDDVPAAIAAREATPCTCPSDSLDLIRSEEGGGCAATNDRADVWPAMLLLAGLWIARRARMAERGRVR